MKYCIISGAAQGLGKALAITLSEKNTTLFIIDKRDLSSTTTECEKLNATVHAFQFDLSNVHEIPSLTEQIFQQIDTQNAESLYLINNASEVVPLGIIGTLENDELVYQIHSDISHYILLTNEVVKRTQDLDIEKKVVCISSGAASAAIPGAAVYGATKAAVDMFTKTTGQEQEKKKFPVQISAVTPGVIDTPMQETLRGTPKEQFPSAYQFKALKASGLLQSPLKTAQKIVKIFTKKKFPNGKVISYIRL